MNSFLPQKLLFINSKEMFNKVLLHIFLILILFGCKKEEIVPEVYLPSNAHEAYLYSLEQANLGETALGLDWKKSAESSLESPVNITLPFEEEFYWDPNSAEATGYRFFVKRGLRIEVEASVNSPDSILLFTDLFREEGDSINDWIHVATADSNYHLEFEPRRDAYYVLRMQPELLRGGRFNVLIRETPSLGFPVSGKNSRAIQSFFGAERDGGVREHHGVDIFAPRHTPVVAPVDATVRRVDVGEVGGRYIYLYDQARSMSLYFAHLETQEVTPGMHVSAGDTIGTVGNSGNAITTPPHLHFGIYARGPIDPLYFIKETNEVPDKILGDTLFLNEWIRSITTAAIRTSPKSSSESIDMMEINSVMKVKGLAGSFYRVVLPDGTSGYIRRNQVELLGNSLVEEIIPKALELLNTPNDKAIYIAEIKSGDAFKVLGKYKDYSYGSTVEGRIGWILNP